jgi:hypothetical protein
LPEPTKEDQVAFARVVSFEGVDKARMDEMKTEMESNDPPEGFPPSELIVLHDGEDKSLVLVLFENEEDYQKGHEILDAMPSGDTPGRRTSVQKYDVAVRMKS